MFQLMLPAGRSQGILYAEQGSGGARAITAGVSGALFPRGEGTFAAWMKRRGKLGGQKKVPRIIIIDEALFNDLRTFAGCG